MNINNNNFDNKFIDEISKITNRIWKNVKTLVDGEKNFRNAQVSLLAPTGTTSSIMGCATTGIESEFSLVRYKRLSGSEGSVIKYVNPILKEALQNLICSNREVNEALEQITQDGHIDNVDVLSEEEKDIFATSISEGKREIHYLGHLKMLSAVQPFISGAISKTINISKNTTIQEIYDIYLKAWKLGIKGLTVYRDGCKSFQPLSSSLNKEKKEQKLIVANTRKKLPNDRIGKIHKFRIGGTTKGYITSGLYKDGNVGEIFVNISRQGSTLAGLMDSLATLTSMALQYGVPLKDIVRKLMLQKFEPMGFTNNKKIKITSSLVDYIFRYLGLNFLDKKDQIEIGLTKSEDQKKENKQIENKLNSKTKLSTSTDPCPNCGMLLRRLGSCSFCTNCNWNSGSCS